MRCLLGAQAIVGVIMAGSGSGVVVLEPDMLGDGEDCEDWGKCVSLRSTGRSREKRLGVLKVLETFERRLPYFGICGNAPLSHG